MQLLEMDGLLLSMCWGGKPGGNGRGKSGALYQGRFLALVFVSVLEHFYHSFAGSSNGFRLASVGAFEPTVFTGATTPT